MKKNTPLEQQLYWMQIMDELLKLLTARALPAGTAVASPDLAEVTAVSLHSKAIDPLMIDLNYTDRNGEKSRRTVILQAITFDLDGPMISAFCCTQRANRTFLMNSIEDVVTRDGEVLGPREYFFGRLGLSGDMGSLNFKTDLGSSRFLPKLARELLGARLGILLIAARIDGELHPEELDKILVFAERELLAADRDGHLRLDFSLELMSAVESFILNIYSLPRNISEYVKSVNQMPKLDRHKFWRTFCELISADGKVSEDERKLVELIETVQLRD